MSLLLELTLRGSVAALAVIALDRSTAGWISGGSRRLWWCLVPLSFMVPLQVPRLPSMGRLPDVANVQNRVLAEIPTVVGLAGDRAGGGGHLLDLWLGGVVAYLGLVAIQTVRASRKWSHERLSTDHALLDLLENCKKETGVTAPIGLVVSESVMSPAIMGWLRPRILLPAQLVEASSIGELRPILLHELAHFRWYDVPFNWLLTMMRAVHWFNPLAHFSAAAWVHFREEAADEAAVRWMGGDPGKAYGDALMRSLRQCHDPTVPFGALGIIESIRQLRRRIRMINRYGRKSPRMPFVGLVSLLLAAAVFSIPASAADSLPSDPRAAVTAGMEAWLTEIDQGHYEQSWRDSSAYFRERVSLKEWEDDLTAARTTFGKCNSRDLASFFIQKDGPKTAGIKHEWAIAQFDASYMNLKYAFETVTFVKEEDGSWRAAGYFTHPK